MSSINSIGVISDTHGSLTAWKQAYTHLKNTDLILHCGDVLYHGPRNPLPTGYDPKSLAEELNATPTPLVFAKGNCDAEVDQILVNYPLEAPYTHLITGFAKILIHHGHVFTTEEIPAFFGGYEIIISGHTHLPGIQKIGNQIRFNPGSPSLPKNDPPIPTVAVINPDEIRILNILSGEAVMAMPIK